MRKAILASTMVLVAVTGAQGAIIGWNCEDDGDGALVMGAKTWTDLGLTGGIPTYQLDMSATQNWHPGHMEGDFTTDTETDPIVWLVQSVDNATTFAWTDYHIAIGMDKPFSIIGVVAPPDWTWIITAPAAGQPLPGHPSPGTGWVGMVDFYAGSPIAIGSSGNFGLVLQFDGSVQFCTEQYPTPEPATLALLLCGGLFLRRSRR